MKNPPKFDRKYDLKKEIARVKEAMKKSKSPYQKRDYAKYLRKLERQWYTVGG